LQQEYKETMKKALQEEKSPLDACLESVLPGVHQWHQANNQAVVRLVERVDVFAEGTAGGINTLITKMERMEQQREEQDRRIVTMLELGAQAFRKEQFSERPLTTTTTATQIENETNRPAGAPPATPTTNEEDDVDVHASYRMRPKHRNLTELYDEWIGAGDFADNYGGIEGRNKKYRAQWRKHIPPHVHSRTERTVEGIRAYAKQKGLHVYDACRQLQAEYEARKFSVANMVNYLINIGVLDKKKSRGRTTHAHDDSA
jgi:Transcriptional activator of glycolytic enzymes